MKLELHIRGHFFASIELKMPANDAFMDFESNYHIREEYIKWMVKSLKNRYQKAIENKEWEIVLIAESRISELLEYEEFKSLGEMISEN